MIWAGIVLAICLYAIWCLLRWIGTNLGYSLNFLFFGRTYSKSDCEQLMRDARRKVKKGQMTQEQFEDLEYEIKKRRPDIQNY